MNYKRWVGGMRTMRVSLKGIMLDTVCVAGVVFLFLLFCGVYLFSLHLSSIIPFLIPSVCVLPPLNKTRNCQPTWHSLLVLVFVKNDKEWQLVTFHFYPLCDFVNLGTAKVWRRSFPTQPLFGIKKKKKTKSWHRHFNWFA